MKSIQPSHCPQMAFPISNSEAPTNLNPNAMLHPSGIWDRYTRASPLPCVQISNEFGDIGAVSLVKRQQRVTARGIRQGGDRQMRAREAFCAIDSEGLTCRDRRVLGSPADVEAADAEIWILGVEVVRVTH